MSAFDQQYSSSSTTTVGNGARSADAFTVTVHSTENIEGWVGHLKHAGEIFWESDAKKTEFKAQKSARKHLREMLIHLSQLADPDMDLVGRR